MAFVVCGLVLLAPSVGAQSMDVRVDRDPAVADYDFSWVYWFETHGQRYVREAVGDRPLPWDAPAARRWRAEAIGALVPGLDDADRGVRAAAVLALARMGHGALLERVLPGGRGRVSLLLDESEAVRLAAWVSLGLLETGAARAALAAEPAEEADEVDRVGQAVAIGLMTKLDRVHGRWLVARLADGGEAVEVKRWCVWAMAQHDDASLDEAFGGALVSLPSAFVMGEVLGHGAYAERRGGAGWLVDVLRYHPDVRGWAGYRALWQLFLDGQDANTVRRQAMETRIAASLTIAEQPLLKKERDRRFLLSQLRQRMVPGNAAQAMDFTRGFDTLAYFMHCTGDQGDRDLLYNQLRGFTSLLADDPGVLEKLEEGETPTAEDLFVSQRDNEVRGYAALAAGLLIRRATEGTGLHEQRPVVAERAIEIERLKRRFGRRLMRAVADGREPVSYRAACALALGLTGDERYKTELGIELGKLKAGDEAVLGYGLLALAMLGEERVVDPAGRYLARPGKVAGVGDRLGRRAALRALAVVGRDGGAGVRQTLTQAWGRDPWVSLHAAEAAAWAGDYGAVPGMLNALAGESVVWRRAAAASLGGLFESSWPSRLSRLTEGSNPTLSLRPMVIKQKVGVARGEAQAQQPVVGADWPMGRVYALSDPFFIALKQSVFDAKPESDQETR